MIEINDKSIVQYVYFPASIKSEVNQYSLEIHSELSQVTNTYTGLTDESNSKTYFKFLLDLSQEDDGEKNYTIKDELEHVVATGLIRIGAIEDEMPEEVSYVPEEEIKIIQYNPNNKFEYRFQTNKQVTVTSNDVYVIKPDLGYDAMLKATVEVNVPTGSTINNQNKNLTYSANTSTTVTFDSGYTGLGTVGINVNVPQTGYTQEDLDNAFASGYTDGVEEQKGKLVSTAVTENGIYTRVDGYSTIDVNVPSGSTINNQTKNVTYTANTATTITFDSGYTGLQQVGINVNVAQTGYTQEDLNNAFSNGFNSGFTSGQTVGYNSGYTAGYASGYTSGSTDGFNSGYESGHTDGFSEGYLSGFTDGYEAAHDYSKEYLTFDIISGGTLTIPYNDDNYSYSLNGGEWVTVSGSGYSISVNDGDKVRFKNKRVLFTGDSNFSGNTVVYNVYGNIMSLLYGDDFIGETTLPNKNDLFYKLFAGTNVVNAEHLILPATTLKSNCYNWMFHSCRSLITAPVLPATTLATKCYFGMFDYCTSLTTAPELPAETLTSQCYSGMFEGCSNLSYIKCLATDISANNCIYEWVLRVKSNGTFIKKSGTTWPTGISGIPNNWTVQEV